MNPDGRHKVRWLTDNVIFPAFQSQAAVVANVISSPPHLALTRRMLSMLVETLMKLSRVEQIGIDVNEEFMRMVLKSAKASSAQSSIDEAKVREWETKIIAANVIDEWHQDVNTHVAKRLMAGHTELGIAPNYAMRRLIERLNHYFTSSIPFVRLDTLTPEDRVAMKTSKLVTAMSITAGPQPIRTADKKAWTTPDIYRGLVAVVFGASGLFARQFIEIERANSPTPLDTNLTPLSVAKRVLARRAGAHILNRHLDDAATFVHYISAQKNMRNVQSAAEIQVGQLFPLVAQNHALGLAIRQWVLELWPDSEWPEPASIAPIQPTGPQ